MKGKGDEKQKQVAPVRFYIQLPDGLVIDSSYFNFGMITFIRYASLKFSWLRVLESSSGSSVFRLSLLSPFLAGKV